MLTEDILAERVLAPSFLHRRGLQLLLFGGKGGVGKTTCATATALRLALDSPDASFLLVSTDPAHSLADSLADSNSPPNLEIVELSAEQSLAAFKEKNRWKLREIATRGTFLDDDDIRQFLDLSLPGLDELMAFFEISKWIEAKTYRCIVVDTAPTGHMIRLLTMPDLVRSWLKALDALLAKHRYMKLLFSGSYQRDDVDDFLVELTSQTNQIKTLLRHKTHCLFVPVMLAEAMSVVETVGLVNELKRLRVPMTDIVINRIYPSNSCRVCAAERARNMNELGSLLTGGILSGYKLWGVPLYPNEVRGVVTLEPFWDDVSQISNVEPVAAKGPVTSAPRVERPAPYPLPEAKLLILAGKGGVGKTSLACATAIRLANHSPGRQVLLFSSDPAHSLSACLDRDIGPEAKRLMVGLTAIEIDSQAEFQTFKNEYLDELEKFLGSVFNDAELAFDSEVVKRILDLAPPGLDEVMALTRAIEFLSRESFDILVLDSAPTGHLIRLLELPEVIDQWLKAFFGIFLKYKHIFRLPRISKRLVEISKNLAKLRGLLRDPARAGVYLVSIPAEMAFEETKDLVAACDRMGINMPALFLNLVTPPSNCSLCSVLHRRESVAIRKFQQAFSRQQQTLVYRQGDVRGMRALAELGEALYGPAQKEAMAYESTRRQQPARSA